MLFRPTLFPVPVAPAMRRCGMRARSVTTGCPTMSCPRARRSSPFPFWNTSAERICLRYTVCLLGLASSIPITALPGIGATILTLLVLRARARSSAREATLLIFTPGAGENSYMVTTGPGHISTTRPDTPKSFSFCSSTLEFSMYSSLSILISSSGGSCRKVRGGRTKSPFTGVT